MSVGLPGSVGVCLPASLTSAMDVVAQVEAVARLQRAGYRAIWTNEVIGKDALVQLAMLLATSEHTVFGTCIANIWARPAQTMHAAAAQLAQAYPGRLVLGLGVGYLEQAASTGRQFGSPLATMRDYLDGMDSPTWPPAPDAAYPRIIAANGPKMLALAAEKADGAMPAGMPAEFTALARQALGPDKHLVVGMSVIVDTDGERAKAAAREDVSNRLAAPSFAARITALGYDAVDIADVSDRLVSALVAHGDSAEIAVSARAHLAAGADHVVLLLPLGSDFATGVQQLERLAPALRSLAG
jgi:probable F420-dependent oxidoreductase